MVLERVRAIAVALERVRAIAVVLERVQGYSCGVSKGTKLQLWRQKG